jgi:hypothetical protein
MGNALSNIKQNVTIGFDDMKFAIDKDYIIITTTCTTESNNLIKKTISPGDEEGVINELITSNNMSKNIIVYGKNNCDQNMYLKYRDLTSFGFLNVFIYSGGLFEWMLLQDIYGFENFPSTTNDLDILRFKPQSILNGVKLLT